MQVVGLHALASDRRLCKIKAGLQGVLEQGNGIFAGTFWTVVYPSIMDAEGDGIYRQCAVQEGLSLRRM